jgi:hypothetical protein
MQPIAPNALGTHACDALQKSFLTHKPAAPLNVQVFGRRAQQRRSAGSFSQPLAPSAARSHASGALQLTNLKQLPALPRNEHALSLSISLTQHTDCAQLLLNAATALHTTGKPLVGRRQRPLFKQYTPLVPLKFDWVQVKQSAADTFGDSCADVNATNKHKVEKNI